MIDDAFRGLTALDRPADPDPRFADRLYHTLAVELGYRSRPQPRGLRAPLRLAYLAAMLGLLAAAALGALLVTGQMLRQQPSELVRLSQAVYDDPPAFSMEITNSEDYRFVISSDGAGTWRVEQVTAGTATPERNDSSYFLYQSGRVATYDVTANSWGVSPESTATSPGGGIRPYPLGTEFAWTVMMLPTPTTGDSFYPRATRIECSSWRSLGEAVVAGRTTDHLVCLERDQQFWIDRDSRLVLAMETGPNTPNWSAGYRIEATSLAFGPPNLAAFSWDGPPGSVSAANQPVGSRLVIGEHPPQWTGAFLDGATFDTGALAAQPTAIYFWGTWCAPCVGQHLEEVRRMVERYPEVATITVAADRASDLRPYASDSILELPIVVDDPEGTPTLMGRWGITVIPSLVLLDRDGAVAGAILMVAGTDLDGVYAALLSANPIPSVPRDE